MVDLTQEQLQYLQGRAQVADFVESIYNDPQLNREAKALIKKKYPGLQIPDYDLEQKIEGRFAQERDARNKEVEQKRREEEDSRWKAERKKTQDEYGLTDDSMKEMEKWMVEKNVGDYDVAASYRAQKNPKVSEPAEDRMYWHHERQNNFAEIAKDPEGWGRSEIMKALRADETRQRGR
jgi:hypothetical protein